MTKKITITSILLLFLTFNAFTQSQKIRFIKGNISDKTSAVREASGDEALWLAKQSISFALENKELLQNDRDLEGLVVAAIFSISKENILSLDDSEKDVLVSQFIDCSINLTTAALCRFQ